MTRPRFMTYPDDRNDNQPNTTTAQNKNRDPKGAHTLATLQVGL